MSSGLKSVKSNASMQTFAVEQSLLAALVTGAIHCSNLRRALDASADLLWRLTTNWRAGCKKFASPVRREGRSFPSCFPSSLPLSSPTQLTDCQTVQERLTHCKSGACTTSSEDFLGAGARGISITLRSYPHAMPLVTRMMPFASDLTSATLCSQKHSKNTSAFGPVTRSSPDSNESTEDVAD